MSKIQELRAEIKRLEEENAESLKNKYQHLVGRCFSRAYTSYEKVTNIHSVNTDDVGEEITYDCICIYFDKRGDEYNNSASISIDGYASVYEEDIEQYSISQESFNEAFNGCVDVIRKRIDA